MINEIANDLKDKKELRDIDNGFLMEFVKREFKSFLIELDGCECGCSGGYKKLKKNAKYKKKFKEAREKLRKMYGLFRQVNERRSEEVYDMLFGKIGNVKSVLDLGCGLSVLDFPFKKYKLDYYACDISRKDVEKAGKCKGVKKAFVFDMVYGDYPKLPSVDVCFLFKVLEGLNIEEKGISERIFKALKCKWIVVSFAKKSITGKVIRKQGRVWMMRLLNKMKWNYEILNSDDEIFYVIKKSD